MLELPWDGVKVWVFGYTNYTTQFRERGIRVVSNQRGYVLPWKSEEGKFDVRRMVWVRLTDSYRSKKHETWTKMRLNGTWLPISSRTDKAKNYRYNVTLILP